MVPRTDRRLAYGAKVRLRSPGQAPHRRAGPLVRGPGGHDRPGRDDVDGTRFLGVTVDDNPAAELHRRTAAATTTGSTRWSRYDADLIAGSGTSSSATMRSGSRSRAASPDRSLAARVSRTSGSWASTSPTSSWRATTSMHDRRRRPGRPPGNHVPHRAQSPDPRPRPRRPRIRSSLGARAGAHDGQLPPPGAAGGLCTGQHGGTPRSLAAGRASSRGGSPVSSLDSSPGPSRRDTHGHSSRSRCSRSRCGVLLVITLLPDLARYAKLRGMERLARSRISPSKVRAVGGGSLEAHRYRVPRGGSGRGGGGGTRRGNGPAAPGHADLRRGGDAAAAVG